MDKVISKIKEKEHQLFEEEELTDFDLSLFLTYKQKGFMYDPLNWYYAFYVGSNPEPPCTHNEIHLICVNQLTMDFSQAQYLDSL